MKTTLLLLLCILSFSVYPQNFKKVEIFFDNPARVKELLNAGMEFDHLQYTKNNSLLTYISENDFKILQNTGFRYTVLIDDWQKYYESLPLLTEAEKQYFINESRDDYNVAGFGFGSMGGHYTLAEMIAELDTMYMLYPNLITQKASIGSTIEGRPIYAVKISDNPNSTENEPRVSFSGVTHAREPMGMMNLIYYMYYLLENYGIDPEVTYLVDNREIFFIPIVNPDGYEYNHSTNPNGGGMWRKNRRNNGSSYGVDLNRNYGPYAYWNAPNGGSSTTPSSDTYRGTAPFSEPETQAVKNYIAGKSIRCALNYHTFGNYLIFPYGALNHETPDSLTFREYAGDMTRYNHYTTGTDLQTVNYSTRGNSDDYMYDGDTVLNAGKTFAMTPEVGNDGDDFWAPQSRIFPLAQECLWMNKYYTWAAGAYVSLKDPNFDRTYFLPGDTVSLQPVFKNKGLSAAGNLNFELTTSSPWAVVVNGTASIDSLAARSEGMILSPMKFVLDPATPVEQNIKLVITSKSGITVMSQDTVSITAGMPYYAFIDTSGVISANWTVGWTPTTSPKWETTTLTYYSAPNSYADSKTGNYISNATVTLTTINNINLAGMPNPRLSFYMKHDFETDWDCGIVQISTNGGTSWISLQGTYSRSGSGSGRQTPAGIPCYDGSRYNWVKEEINLNAYIGQQIKLRFELRSDASIEKDGWYLDDIRVFYYGAAQYTLNITAMIEGLYNGITMIPDTVTVELRDTASPFSLVESKKIFLNSSGSGSAVFASATGGIPYYIVLKHRNAVESWSSTGIAFSGSNLNYDFTTAADQTYGSNQVLKGTKWCIYSGDIDQDGRIDLRDLAQMDNGIHNSLTGYVPEDLNGDGIVNVNDMNIGEANAVQFIQSKKP